MMTTTTDPKEIRYCDGDYRASYEGNCIGFYPSYWAAEIALDEHASDLARQTAIDTADMAADAAAEASTGAPPGACKACGGEHHIQSCPEIATALLAPSAVINIPEDWTQPTFALGQTVYLTGTDNEPYTVVGVRYATYRHSDPSWQYQISEHPDCLSSIAEHGYRSDTFDASDFSAEPWPIEGEFCVGVEYPCGKPAAYWYVSSTGNDMETARRVDLAYCPACWKRLGDIERMEQLAADHARIAVSI